MRKAAILLVFALLASCNSVVDAAKNIDYDTNGYYSKRKHDGPPLCEYRVSSNVTAFRPCR